MPKKKISIIIVNYKSKEFLEKCLFSVWEKIPSEISFEVIVFNNDISENLESLWIKYPGIKIISSPINIGFASGANLAVKSARNNLLFFLNPDSEIISKNIGDVLNFFKKNPEAGALGGKILDEKGQTQDWNAGFETSLFDLILNNLGFPRSRKIWTSPKAKRADWVSGANLFIKKSVFEKVNGFDEKFFMYFEDMDICKRIKKNGHTIFFFPFFSIKHLGGKSYGENESQKKKDYYFSQAYYFKKHKNFLERNVFLILKKIFFYA